MEEQSLTLDEMKSKFDVTARTLRYYESIELLQPERKGSTRIYRPSEVARLTLILRGKRFGFKLEEIRQWLLIYERSGSQEQILAFVEMADRKLEELKQEHLLLSEAMAELRKTRATAMEMAGCLTSAPLGQI